MKLLRILTGVHAGAQLRLARERYVVGNDAEADILLSDWQHEPMRLTVTDDQGVLVAPLGRPDPPPDAEPDALEDLVPRRFGDIVLCIGPVDEPWPSDMRLLEGMIDGARKPAKKKPRKLPPGRPRARPPKHVLILGGVVSAGLLAGFVSVIGPNRSASAAVNEEPLHLTVTRAIQAAGVMGVSVRTAPDGHLSVEGMVIDGAEGARVRNALLPFGSGRVAHRYASASDVAQSISDALANPGLSVRYRGDGEFSVTGSSVDLDGVRGKLRRITTDLGPAVGRITLAATELPPPAVLPTNALMSSGDLQYVQTRDGTKHLEIRTPVEDGEIVELRR